MGSAATGTTCEDVKRRLAATVLTLPTTPIDSARPGEVDLLDPNVAPATFDWLTVSAEVLAQQPTTADFADMGARRIAIRRDLPNPRGGGAACDSRGEFDIDCSSFDHSVPRLRKMLADVWNTRQLVQRRFRSMIFIDILQDLQNDFYFEKFFGRRL